MFFWCKRVVWLKLGSARAHFINKGQKEQIYWDCKLIRIRIREKHKTNTAITSFAEPKTVAKSAAILPISDHLCKYRDLFAFFPRYLQECWEMSIMWVIFAPLYLHYSRIIPIFYWCLSEREFSTLSAHIFRLKYLQNNTFDLIIIVISCDWCDKKTLTVCAPL